MYICGVGEHFIDIELIDSDGVLENEGVFYIPYDDSLMTLLNDESDGVSVLTVIFAISFQPLESYMRLYLSDGDEMDLNLLLDQSEVNVLRDVCESRT